MKHFNVRVYGILIENDRLLVSDEYIKGMNITKLPGGGLEFGEGTIDCVVREFKEELGFEVEVTGHFYTTDFFVHSAFNTNSQVISIYYYVRPTGTMNIPVSDIPFNFERKEGAQAFRWIDCSTLSEKDFTFIIDKRVGDMLSAGY